MKKKAELISKAYARYIRISPRKVRLVLNLIRGEKVPGALAILNSLNKRAKVYVEKVLKSAISNAQRNPAIATDELFISKITADNGPMLKRYRAAAMGRATTILHRTTHLTVELARAVERQIATKPKPQRKAGRLSRLKPGRSKAAKRRTRS